MQQMFLELGLVVASYLMGSLSAAVLVCRALGKGDPRTVGSGNPGATNVLRAYGKGAAAATLIGDIAKGVVPVLAARYAGFGPLVVGGCAVAAFLGHLFPVFFGFKGGKGVATYIGVLLAMSHWLGLGFIATWLSTAALTRYSSLAALVATLTTPILAFALGLPLPLTLASLVMGAAIFYRHQANIARLLAGTEGRIGKKPA
jgi:glycerol-3-phosphate acyltransferase PlsY